jgi:hypothetical protein
MRKSGQYRYGKGKGQGKKSLKLMQVISRVIYHKNYRPFTGEFRRPFSAASLKRACAGRLSGSLPRLSRSLRRLRESAAFA